MSGNKKQESRPGGSIESSNDRNKDLTRINENRRRMVEKRIEIQSKTTENRTKSQSKINTDGCNDCIIEDGSKSRTIERWNETRIIAIAEFGNENN